MVWAFRTDKHSVKKGRTSLELILCCLPWEQACTNVSQEPQVPISRAAAQPGCPLPVPALAIPGGGLCICPCWIWWGPCQPISQTCLVPLSVSPALRGADCSPQLGITCKIVHMHSTFTLKFLILNRACPSTKYLQSSIGNEPLGRIQTINNYSVPRDPDSFLASW